MYIDTNERRKQREIEAMQRFGIKTQASSANMLLRGSANRDRKKETKKLPASQPKKDTSAYTPFKAAANAAAAQAQSNSTIAAMAAEIVRDAFHGVKGAYTKAAENDAANKTAAALNTSKAVKGAVRDTVQNMGQAGSSYSAAQMTVAQQNRAAITKAGNAVAKGAAQLGSAQAAQNRAASDTVIHTVKDASKEYGEVWGATTGVTGSDQTGASLWGYRKDNRYKEPQAHWDVETIKEYHERKLRNPKDAENFAIAVNEAYNSMQHENKESRLADWVSNGNGVIGWLGARATNIGSGLDSYNRMLERAAIGRNLIGNSLSATDIKETIDDTNKENIIDNHGVLAGAAYGGISYLTDKLLANALLGQDLGSGMKIKTKDLMTAAKISNIVAEGVAGSKQWFETNREAIDELATYYMEMDGNSPNYAKHRATKELLIEAYEKRLK